MSELPKPDWGREGETWRIEPEDAVPWRTDVYGLLCRVRDADGINGICRDRAVAGYSTRNGEFRPFCERHLTEQNMWIEDEGVAPRGGRVVSWRLSK